MRVEAKDGEATLWVYDPIGEMFGPDAVSPKGVRDRLDKLRGVNRLTVRINSPGGLVDDAVAIRTLLNDYDAEKVFKVDGLAASAATVLPTDGARVQVATGATMMIHNPWSIAVGDYRDMLKAAEIAEKYRENLAGIYATRSGQDREAVLAAMDAETWFTSDEAVEWGLADASDEETPAVKATAEDTAKVLDYAKEVARIAAIALVADSNSEAAEQAAASTLEVGRRINAEHRARRLEVATAILNRSA